MTLRISLRPVPDIFSSHSKRAARQRAGVVEVDCSLRLESFSPTAPPPLSEDVSIVIKLDCRATASRALPPAAQSKLQREAEALEQEERKAQPPPQPVQPIPADQPEAMPQAAVAEQTAVELPAAQELPQEQSSSQEPFPIAEQLEQPPVNVSYASEPMPSQDPLAEASAHLRSAVMTPVDERSSGMHIPSVEQQMAAQDQHQLQPPPPEAFYPHFPVFHEPFIGLDGFTYYFDPATGQSLPGPPLPYAPGYPMDLPPPSASPVPFFAPRRSRKVEIKAPTPESLAELRSKSKNKHRQTPSSSNRSQPYPMEELPPEMFIPGSFEVGGSVFFAPPPQFAPPFSAPPPFYMPGPNGMPSDPAILAMGVATPDAGHPQAIPMDA
jgi:hypothetical protein